MDASIARARPRGKRRAECGGNHEGVDARVGVRNHAPMDDLFRLPAALRRDPAIAAWFDIADPYRLMARPWFERMRSCGPDVREILHDGAPTACIGDAAFGYVNAHRAHASVGFFRGAALPDPERLLRGAGKRMRHVKLIAGEAIDEPALQALIVAAADEVRRLSRAD